MNQQMTIWGVGPKFALVSILYFIFVLIIHSVFYPLFVIESIPYSLLITIGVLLIGIGIPIWVLSARSIVKGFSQGKLVTHGIYSICRHPLYGNGIFFTFPGILFFLKSYILLTLPIFMYFSFKILISAEERYLREKFRDQYIAYANNVNMVFPKFWKMLT